MFPKIGSCKKSVDDRKRMLVLQGNNLTGVKANSESSNVLS